MGTNAAAGTPLTPARQRTSSASARLQAGAAARALEGIEGEHVGSGSEGGSAVLQPLAVEIRTPASHSQPSGVASERLA